MSQKSTTTQALIAVLVCTAVFAVIGVRSMNKANAVKPAAKPEESTPAVVRQPVEILNQWEQIGLNMHRYIDADVGSICYSTDPNQYHASVSCYQEIAIMQIPTAKEQTK